jgi:TPR repeat protein
MKPKFIISVVVLAGAVFGVACFIFQQQATYVPPAPNSVTSNTNSIDLAGLKAKADAGDPAAQTHLAQAYLGGSAGKTDITNAVKYLQLAADKNYPDALAALGELTQAGQGVPRNLDAATQLYRRAADGGSVAGQYNLAYLYEQGTGVKQDEKEAAKWYQLAAEGGDPIAQFDIGQRYKLGVGVATNLVQALKWLSLAAAQGQSDSAKLLPVVQNQMSGDQLTEARQLVSQFTPRASGK